ncbi:hypothetical protein Daus18300_010310 [Diaporthe australafricana]|uniref:Heterokaryon incompatibility domain-containing protein n=1 Tax=Diaporthe australafricana TaxID=127596 RepID=A0ABR3WAS0_9PEZI
MKSCLTYLDGWIQECNKQHGDKCQVEPIAGRPTHHIPDWVIDSEDGCIVRGCSIPRYVALSYVWSPAVKDSITVDEVGDRLMLQSENLEDFRRAGFLRSGILERVPVVIRDAINFVQLSGFRYIWVDSLCIVQHEDTTQDRVGLMNEIYSGAYFTIIAAASSKRLYGNELDDGRHLPYESLSARDLHSKLLCSHWASRGWTFQEQLLSKRSIIFLDNVFFWDCQRDVQWPPPEADEKPGSFVGLQTTLQVRKPPIARKNPMEEGALTEVDRKSRNMDDKPKDLTSLSPVPDFKFYIELVCRYSNRNLTYDQDVLPAFSGVIEAFSRQTFRGGFVSGLPALFLDSALLWQPLLKARRRSMVGAGARIAPKAPLPSWSWAGWQCLVDPESLRGGLDFIAYNDAAPSVAETSSQDELRPRCKLVFNSSLAEFDALPGANFQLQKTGDIVQMPV